MHFQEETELSQTVRNNKKLVKDIQAKFTCEIETFDPPSLSQISVTGNVMLVRNSPRSAATVKKSKCINYFIVSISIMNAAVFK